MTREELEEKIALFLSDYGEQMWITEDTTDSVGAMMALIDSYISTLPQTKWMVDNKIVFNSLNKEK